jgi:type IV pilus assembly protein PilY1
VAADVSLVDANQDGKVDFAYAADTGGNIYRINFSNPATFANLPPTASGSLAGWNIVTVAYTRDVTNPRKFLFAPTLAAVNKKVFIAIASGDREHPTDQSYPFTKPILNRGYVYRDDLASAAYDLDTTTDNITADNTCTASGLQVASRKSWFLNLAHPSNASLRRGEQAVTSALISAGVVFFSTNRPFNENDKEFIAACGAGLGEARGYALNLFNGSGAIGVNPACGGERSGIFVGGGLAPSPVTGVVMVDGVVQNVVIGGIKLDGTTSTPFGGQKLNPSISKTRSRVYWKTNTDSK